QGVDDVGRQIAVQISGESVTPPPPPPPFPWVNVLPCFFMQTSRFERSKTYAGKARMRREAHGHKPVYCISNAARRALLRTIGDAIYEASHVLIDVCGSCSVAEAAAAHAAAVAAADAAAAAAAA